MSYQGYVVAAYVVFVAAMLWDGLQPLLQVRRALRAVRLRVARARATDQSAAARTPRD